MKKKKKYLCPEIDVVYSYDFESELMYYGGGTITGGDTSTIITGSNGSSSDSNIGGVDDNSDRAKSNIWGNIWEDDF